MFSVENMKILIIAVAVISCACSLFVVVTYCTFKEMREKVFMKFIFNIALSDLGLNLSSCFGFPNGSSPLCTAQGVLALFFGVASWFWTLCLSYSLFYIVRNGKSPCTFRWFHIFCWGFSAALSLLPLVTNRYGSSSIQWCVIIDRADSPPWTKRFWLYAGYFGWLLVCVILMSFWSYLIHLDIASKSEALSVILKKTHDKVRLYPYAMMACWILNYLTFLPNHPSDFVVGTGMIFGECYGIVSAVIFVVKSEETQRRWFDLLFANKFGIRPNQTNIPIDFLGDEGLLQADKSPFTSDSFSQSAFSENNL